MQVINDNSFKSEVLESELPVVLDFFAEWCGPCQMLLPVIEEMATAYEGQVKFVKIDTDESPNVARRYEVKSIPTLLVFKDGQPVARGVGYMDKGRLQDFIEQNAL
ncbi:TPA: thioredoxin [bacterium UBP9_UBA11836]|nr:thioredoxin [bacterium UBP9_UBA11836]